MDRHKSSQEWTSSTSAKSGEAVLAAGLRKQMRKITSQIIHYNIGSREEECVNHIKKPFRVRMTQLSWRKMRRTIDISWTIFNVYVQGDISGAYESGLQPEFP